MSDERPREDVEATCPQCGTSIADHDGSCPSCGLVFLDDEGGLTDEAADALFEDSNLDLENLDLSRSEYYTPQWMRLIVGLAISTPMAPLVLFVVGSIVSLPLWVSGLVFVLGWLLPAVLLSRLALPSVIVAVGLVVLGSTLALAPPAIVVGRAVVGSDAETIGTFGPDAWAAQAAFLAVGIVVLGLGGFLYRYASVKRGAWAEDGHR
ncbi:zinc ribbon domain-containing protein [Halapricum hydrolyticum]|uniref:Zinc ribbon domain-containing protein n=1 Tax=Halapricum hydrolyticum TaxID=2979991 RepID=A0AAE3IC99_9EURY|nr:zinc ribbon domain-containing protein [Halapricum hydrolyticum]MCU4718917.1 zinc ribbon domain-containing protein [Halapricum hydrolyticum]MCU4727990.1 zinc ribbon domain-containing protein [Halapricum hydrolyticum]